VTCARNWRLLLNVTQRAGYEGKKRKFAGRVGTGFSDKLLRSLFSDLEKIRVEKCPFFNVPATGRSRWDQGLTAAEMRRCHWIKPAMVCQIKFTEWTRDARLRQPVFLGIREDKNANEVVRKRRCKWPINVLREIATNAESASGFYRRYRKTKRPNR
jgi:ATP-dependent DNA ligase